MPPPLGLDWACYQRLKVGAADPFGFENGLVVVLGHPAYYPRFGIISAENKGSDGSMIPRWRCSWYRSLLRAHFRA